MYNVSQLHCSQDPVKPSEGNPTENNENNLKNISPFMSKDLIAAAGFNVETPIVNAIIGNLTGTLPTKKNEAEMIKCAICGCELSSFVVFKLHLNGSKHKKRLKAQEIIAQLKNGKNKGINLGDRDYPKSFRCEVCLLTVNSAQQLEIHLSGAKHKRKAAKTNFTEYLSTISRKKNESNQSSGSSEVTRPPPAKRQKEESKLICCDICNVLTNSRTQYVQHLISKKHLNRTNGQKSRAFRY